MKINQIGINNNATFNAKRNTKLERIYTCFKSVYGNVSTPMINDNPVQLWTMDKGNYCDSKISAAKGFGGY